MTTNGPLSRTARPLAAAGLGLALGLALATPALALEPPASARTDEVRRLERWPEPVDREQLRLDVRRLRKAETEGMEQGAREGLRAEGAAAAPALLDALGREDGEDARERIVSVLEVVTGAPHTRLLAARFDDSSHRVRAFALRRAAAFPDPGVRAAAEKARERAAVALEDEKLKSGERAERREELYLASLCATAAGSLVGLDELERRAREQWDRSGRELRTALEQVRGPEATARLLPDLESPDRATVVAALRLLAGCGERETAPPRIAPLLDHTDNEIRVAAINALRGVVDGQPPVERLPVFEAIERANAWKKRL